MRKSFVLLGVAIVLSNLLIMGCSQSAPAPTAAPAAPTKAAAPQPTAIPAQAAPTKAPAAQPTAVPQVDFPAKGKSLTLIMPWAAGGGTDISGRIIAGGIEKVLGVPVQVVNKEGAGSQVGLTEIMKAKPDGYTFGTITIPTAILSYLDKSKGAVYTRKDFQPIAMYANDATVLLVKADSPYKSIKDLLDVAKADPGKMRFGDSGVGTGTHLMSVSLIDQSGIKFSMVHFNSSAAGITAVLGEHVEAMVANQAAVAFNKMPDIRTVAIMGDQRLDCIPGALTAREQGYDLSLYSSAALVAPAGTPKEIVAILNDAVKKAMAMDEVKTKLDALGGVGSYMDSATFENFWINLETKVTPMVSKMTEQ
jgi:tripartite-type tricarboxylate transporter receptor subunit TctC